MITQPLTVLDHHYQELSIDGKDVIKGCLKSIRLDETDNLQKPNPPAPFPTLAQRAEGWERGFQSLSPLRGEVWRGVCLYIKNLFIHPLRGLTEKPKSLPPKYFYDG
jgi:hypothetical protein